MGRKKKEIVLSPEVRARTIVGVICVAFFQLQREQAALLQEMGYTQGGRHNLALLLAHSLYATGIAGLSSDTLHEVMSDAMLSDILYPLVCGTSYEQVVERMSLLLLQRPEFQAYHARRAAEQEQEQEQQSSLPAPVSEVSPDDRHDGQRSISLRTGRSARRVGWSYSRAVPESRLSL